MAANKGGVWTEIGGLAGLLGGRGFAAALFLYAVFSLALFHLRAEPIFDAPPSLAEAGKGDFPAFWRAGEMALGGNAAQAYDPAAFRSGFGEDGQGLLFLNPPQFFLLIWPFSLLSYGVAKTVWLVLNALALAAVAVLAGRGRTQTGLFLVFLALSPAAFAAFLPAQVSPLVAAGLLAAMILAKERPIAAGLLLALLTAKPQYAMLVPVFLAARGEWRAFAAAAVLSLLFAALSFFVLGAQAWTAFFGALGGEHLSHAELLMRDMVTVHQTAGKLGAGPAARMAAQLAAAAGGAVMVWTVARRWRRDAAIGFTLIASTFVSLSLWVYDWPMFAAGLFMLARECGRWPASLQLAAALLWAAPLISLGFATMDSSLAAPAIAAIAIGLFFVRGKTLFAVT